jgi:hypothetical protein
MAAKPAKGAVMGINVCRDRTLAEREWSCWSRVAANFHDPAHFGNLVLAPTPGQLAQLGPELRRGDRQGPLLICGVKGLGDQTYAGLARARLARVESCLAELRALGRRESPAAAAAVATRADAAQARLAPIRSQLAGDVNGADYARLELTLAGMERELGAVLWEARLEALLADL